MSSNPARPANPWLATRTRTGQEYDAPYETRAAAGSDVHGEATCIERLVQAHASPHATPPPRVLDAGCGTGRVAIELAQRGMAVVGVDLDAVMLTQARTKAPHLDWHLADLSTVQLEQPFDCIVLAGNVMIYLTPGTEAATLENLARHLKPAGLLVAAFEIPAPSWSSLTVALYDQLADAVGLTAISRWSTWQQEPWYPDARYAISVHQK
jgi:SAM-dependent methyltransferase